MSERFNSSRNPLIQLQQHSTKSGFRFLALNILKQPSKSVCRNPGAVPVVIALPRHPSAAAHMRRRPSAGSGSNDCRVVWVSQRRRRRPAHSPQTIRQTPGCVAAAAHMPRCAPCRGVWARHLLRPISAACVNFTLSRRFWTGNRSCRRGACIAGDL